MITPFGRYRWRRLPFGLKVSSDIFQRKLDKALEGLEGVFSVVDDVLIAGCGQTVNEAQIDNQRKLAETLKRCAEKNIVLNEDKQQTGLTKITFQVTESQRMVSKLMKPKCNMPSATCQNPLM